MAVRTADGLLLEKRAMTTLVRGVDFPVVWACWDVEYDEKTARFLEERGITSSVCREYEIPGSPWPVEDVFPLDQAPGDVLSHEDFISLRDANA